MPSDEVIEALEAALRQNPESVPIRVHLAGLLAGRGDHERALAMAGEALAREPANLDALRLAATSSAAVGDEDRALGYRRLLSALGQSDATLAIPGTDPDVPAAPRAADDEFVDIVREVFGEDVSAASTPDIARSEWEVERPDITLEDVAGMADVKRRLDLSFLSPMRNPEVMKAYGMRLRGGLLLYGPPGCGKTYLARATAGELGTRFLGVGLSDVLDMYIGESERKLHEIFEEARRNAPCVLFFDEVDALGQKRSELRSAPYYRRLVNQLLAELDGEESNNDGLYVLAASNHPWDIDTALRRPGRLDRMMLVLPPDRPAREAIVRLNLRSRPADKVNPATVASQTEGFSGADLSHLCESAAEAAMEDSLRAGTIRQMTTDDFRSALKEIRPSTRPWFEIAKNYAQFANEGGLYDDLLAYIRTHRI
jgi:SpoVK/Ycf46/Vps4 family AAA+-type ATPase